jgi:hypothetical protein
MSRRGGGLGLDAALARVAMEGCGDILLFAVKFTLALTTLTLSAVTEAPVDLYHVGHGRGYQGRPYGGGHG